VTAVQQVPQRAFEVEDEVGDVGDYLIEGGERLGRVRRVVIAIHGLQERD
jgi:hypothetical protein